MSWAKFDDRFLMNPKIMQAGLEARALYISSILYCAGELTDGFIAQGVVFKLAALADVPDARASTDKLLALGLWETAIGGFHIHDYLDYNPTKQRVIATKEARAEAGAEGGKQKASKLLDASQPAASEMSLQVSSKSLPRTRTPSPTRTNDPEPEPEHPAPQPAGGGSPSKFNFKRLWALIEAQQDFLPTWSYEVETQVVKAILKTHPGVTPDDMADFIAYKRTCYGIDPASQPSFSKYKGDFGAWFAAGKPEKQEKRNGNHTKQSNTNGAVLSRVLSGLAEEALDLTPGPDSYSALGPGP